jgi:hypothetical protein
MLIDFKSVHSSQAKIFEQSMMSLFSGAAAGQPGVQADPSPEQMAMGFERIREAASLAMQSNADEITSVDPQFSQSIKDALKVGFPITQKMYTVLTSNCSLNFRD